MIAARMSIGSFAKEAWNADAAPWNVAWILAGRPISFRAWFTALTASPNEVPGATLNERVTTGNWPRWLTLIGPVVSSRCAKVLSGTCAPVGKASEDGMELESEDPVAPGC